MTAALLDHLWQSTLFAMGIWLLTLATRNNAARIRYQLWFAASVKFLVPFSILVAIGSAFAPAMPHVAMPDLQFMQQMAQPFAATAPLIALPAPSGLDPATLLLTLWLSGFLTVLAIWLVRLSRVRAVLREAVTLRVPAPITVKGTNTALGPGLFGIFRPVLLLPQGITARLTPMEMRAILDHELCHLERRDNLTAAIHRMVEALFWFHPLVWWLGAQMIAERERACDEAVVQEGNEAGTYADGILKVCRFYAGPPPPLAAAVLGAGLEGRVEAIMAGHAIRDLSGGQKALIRLCLLLAVLCPLAAGWTGAIREQTARVTARIAGENAATAGLNRYMAQLQMGKRNAGERLHEGGLWRQDTTSRADCENHFLAVLQVLEKGYGKFAPLYPQRAKNDQDRIPISLMWKTGPGDSRYQEATVYMTAETAHVWDARRLLQGRAINAAAVWSAQSESTDAVCLTEISVRA